MGSPTGNPADFASMAVYPRVVQAISAGFTLAPTDAGKVFEIAGTMNVIVPVGLQLNFHCSFMPLTGTLSIVSDGTALLNGATTTLTRAAATAGNGLFTLQKRVTVADSYTVMGS